jgi:O-succinylbenzoic acid--CoA ligase
LNLSEFNLKDIFDNTNIFIHKNNARYTYKEISKYISKASYFLDKKEIAQKIALSFEDPFLQLIFIFAAWNNNLAVISLSHKSPQEELNEKANSSYLLDDSKMTLDQLLKIESSRELQTISDLDSEALIVYTSGSSSKAKSIKLSFLNLLSSAAGTTDFYEINENDSWLLSLPLNHVGGLLIPLRCMLKSACVKIGTPGNESSDLLILKPSIISLVSTQLVKILGNNDSHVNSQLKQCKAIILGGGRTPDSVLTQACSLKLNLANSYGQTEMCAQITSTEVCHDIEVLKTVGKALPYRKFKIIDQELYVGGLPLSNAIILENNVSSFNGDYFYKTSDIGVLDKRGNLIIKGRSDDVFISGGENISPLEVEKALNSLPFIDESYVVPCLDPKFDNIPVAFIKSSEPYEAKEINTKLKSIIHPYHIPKIYISLSDIPTPQSLGKIKYSKADLKKYAHLLYQPTSSKFNREILGNLNGEIIIFLHGFMGSSSSFVNIFEKLKNDFCIITYDLAGHGNTKASHFSSWEEHSNYLLDDIISLNSQVHLVGYSQGGRVATAMALKSPTNFKSLILESSSFGIKDNTERISRFKKDLELLKNIKNEEEFKKFLNNWYDLELFGDIKSQSNYPKLLNDLLNNNLDELRASLKLLSVGTQPYLQDDLNQLDQINFHFISGEKDKKYTEIGTTISKSTKCIHHIIPNSSHNIHFENPNEFYILLKSLITFN